MRLLQKVLGALAFTLCVATPCTADAQQAAPLMEMEQAFARMVNEGRRAGIVWIVAKDGKVVSQGALGWQNIADRIPMSADSRFRLYSMSRAVTSVAALRLVEQGRLDLEAPLERYLPAFANPRVFVATPDDAEPRIEPARRALLVRDLLTYKSGFGYAYDYPASAQLKRDEVIGLGVSTAQGIDHLAGFPLLHQPGTRWHYGFSSDVLGRVIEIVTGERLDRALQRLVFEPVGMKSSGFFTSADHLASAYGFEPGGATLVDMSARLPKSADYLHEGRMHSGGGGLVATAADYLAFCEMLRNAGRARGRVVLTPRTVELMLTNTMAPNEGPLYWYQKSPPAVVEGGGWGLGVGLRIRDVDNGTLTSRRGEIFWGGLAGTGFFIDPQHGVSAVVMTQYVGADIDEPALMLRRFVYAAFARGGR
jgi:CubicO group peptidase (beta-lactamase class C family)